MRSALVQSALLIATSYAQAPPTPADSNAKGTTFLDHVKPIKDFPGRSFLKQNIPFIDLPDSKVEEIFYFRFSSLQRHLRYTTPGTGYITTEFVQPVSYAGPLDTLDAASGHLMEEARWYRSTFYNEDYLQIFTRGYGSPTRYSNWIAEAAEATANATGDQAFLNSQLQGMVRMYNAWDGNFSFDIGLYSIEPTLDAQEFSLPGYVADPTIYSTIHALQRNGPQTYRPSFNAFMYANARTISKLASTVGDAATAKQFSTKTTNLETAILKSLWNNDSSFFTDYIESGQPGAGLLSGREEVGFYPYRFGLGLDTNHIRPAVTQLYSKFGFNATYGPTTLEIRNKFYNATKQISSYCCFWNGQSWPFSTAHTLKSLAEMHRVDNSLVTADQYHQSLSVYTNTHYLNGKPYLAEAHYPEIDDWSGNKANHSQFYAHSTYNDLVITGLLGLKPRSDNMLEIDPIIPSTWTYFTLENVPYHGHLITIRYDKTGSRYNNGTGLTVYQNGAFLQNNATGTYTLVALPNSSPSNPQASTPLAVNVAASPFGVAGIGAWPRAKATFSGNLDDPAKAIDGYLFYDVSPDNRWSNVGSKNAKDTLTVQLARPRNLTGVALAIYEGAVASTTASGTAACPASIVITDGTGNQLANIQSFSSQCIANDINVINFKSEVTVSEINITLEPQSGSAVGIAEVELWTEANTGPFYFATDALPSTAALQHVDIKTASKIVFDPDNAKMTSNGAVMAPISGKSEMVFSGIFSLNDDVVSLGLRYKNNGTNSPVISVLVNQVAAGTLTLPGTKSAYATVALNKVSLLRGTNFVILSGGGEGVFVEGLEVM